MVTCPECGEKLQRKGLHGHLRFKHQMDGDELDKAYNGQVKAGEKQRKKVEEQLVHRAMIDRISKLHDELRNVRAKLQEVAAGDQGNFFLTDLATKNLQKLYRAEEKRILADLERLVQEGASKPKSKGGFWSL